MNLESKQEGNLAALLRHLRTDRGFSVGNLARLASINRRTVARWEQGENQPSLPELKSVLDVLNVTSEESDQAIRYIAAPRAQKRMLRESRVIVAGQGISPPVGGDLLRALRVRQRRTQQDVARRLSITQATLARWENGQAWPSPALLHSLCWELKAHLDEVKALTVGRFSPATFLEYEGKSHRRCPPRSVEELQARLQHLRLPSGDLDDLYTLAYISGMWALGAERNPHLLSHFALAYSDRARFLMDAGRLAEAEEPAHISLELVINDLAPILNTRSFVTAALVLAERDVYGDGFPLSIRRATTFDSRESKRKMNYQWGINRLQKTLESVAMRWEYRTWVMAHIARYAFGTGDGDAAIDWAERAYCTIDQDDEMGAQDQWARRELWMRLLIHTGRYVEATVLLPDVDISGLPLKEAPGAVPALLFRAEAFWLLGNRSEARNQIDQIRNMSIANGWNTALIQANNLANRL